MTTTISAPTDALGVLVRLTRLPGQRFEAVGEPPLANGVALMDNPTRFAASIKKTRSAWLRPPGRARDVFQ